ncbi:hypothetical protein SAMN05216266_107293 [Amycolatopsis marina]|uniref:Uncharacterized protein n=1 Tax=Amycolatopsis marina TaxID=490629 RepID=A0A1I0ZV27_9PSEU|nr:hypothetical protein [Amycolatopsis marina]SFB29142.1 hypothetical protein SAMN05216266_107293 [Amycolatopsis marina]
MAIPKGYRFPIEFDEAFPQGLVMVGGRSTPSGKSSAASGSGESTTKAGRMRAAELDAETS